MAKSDITALTRFSTSKLPYFIPTEATDANSEGGEGISYGEVIRALEGLGNEEDFNADEWFDEGTGSLDFWKINDEIQKFELSREDRGKFMIERWGGFKEFNTYLDAVQNSFKILGYPDIDEASAAAFLSKDTEQVNDLVGYAAHIKHGTAEATRKINEEDVISGLHTQEEFNNGSLHVITEAEALRPLDSWKNGMYDFNNFEPEYAATTPYDFDSHTRIYGRTVNKDGAEIETGDWFTGSEDPDWEVDPDLGLVYKDKENPDRKFSKKTGWVTSSEENGKWFQSEETGEWMFPYTFANGDQGWMVGDEGIVPTSDTKASKDVANGSKFYSFNRGDYYEASDSDNSSTVLAEVEGPAARFKALRKRQLDARENGTEAQKAFVDSDIDGPIATTYFEDPKGSNPSEEILGDYEGRILEMSRDGGKTWEVMNDWYTNDLGNYFAVDTNPNWRHYDGDNAVIDGWWYTAEGTNWHWQDGKGWNWNEESQAGSYFYNSNSSSWAWTDKAREGFLDPEGNEFVFTSGGSKDSPPSQPPRDENGRIASPISYAHRFLQDESGELDRLRSELNNAAQTYRNIGADDGMISRMLKGTSIYKKIMQKLGGEDAADARMLVDDIVTQVAKVNASKANIAGNLDMADNRGFEMLDPRLTQEQKGDLRFAKPSITANEWHVEQGLASEVGQVIRNPDYDENLSMFFEHVNPETGELETRSFRSDFGGKAPFMRTQEKLIDASVSNTDKWTDAVSQRGEDGLTDYERKYGKVKKLLQDAGISDVEGGDGLYTREGIKQMNYVFGDDKNSMEGKTNDLFDAQKFLMDKSNYFENQGLKDEIDKRSRYASAQADIDPVANARIRGAQRVNQARFGEGIDMLDPNAMEKKLTPKVDFKNLNNVDGLDNGYTANELELAGIGSGVKPPSIIDKEKTRNNQYLVDGVV